MGTAVWKQNLPVPSCYQPNCDVRVWLRWAKKRNFCPGMFQQKVLKSIYKRRTEKEVPVQLTLQSPLYFQDLVHFKNIVNRSYFAAFSHTLYLNDSGSRRQIEPPSVNTAIQGSTVWYTTRYSVDTVWKHVDFFESEQPKFQLLHLLKDCFHANCSAKNTGTWSCLSSCERCHARLLLWNGKHFCRLLSSKPLCSIYYTQQQKKYCFLRLYILSLQD